MGSIAALPAWIVLSPASHPKPLTDSLRASAEASCDCSNSAQASVEEVCEYVELQNATKYDLVKPDGQAITGAWEADFGSVDSNGTYIAPLNLEEPRIDILRLRSASDPTVILAQVRMHISGGNTNPDPGAPDHTWMDSPNQGTSAVTEPVLATSSVAVDEVPVVSPQVFQLAELQPIASQLAGSKTAYPVRNVVGGMTVLLAGQKQPQKGKKCRIFPGKDDVSGTQCIPGRSTIERGGGSIGQNVYKEDYGPWKAKSGQYTANAGVETAGGISAGVSFPGSYETRTVTRYCYKDVYKCKNGVYVYDHSEFCSQTRQDYQKCDPWYLIYVLLPPNGTSPGPFVPTLPNCTPL